jgi:hypothetical protein
VARDAMFLADCIADGVGDAVRPPSRLALAA